MYRKIREKQLKLSNITRIDIFNITYWNIYDLVTSQFFPNLV